MKDEILSARFEGLLKRYREKLELLDLDLPAPTETPPKPPEEPAPVPREEAPPEPEPAVQESVRPGPEEPPLPPAPELPAWEQPSLRESGPPERPASAPVPAPKPPRRDGKPAALALLASLAAALVWGLLNFADEPAYRAFSLSRTQVRGLAWREGKVVVADAEERFLLLYKEDGRRLDSKESIDSSDLSDLCWADGAFWSTKPGRRAIFQHDDPPEHGVRRIYATPGRLPAPLAGDNENLWAADAAAAVLYRYLIGHSLNGVSLTPLNQYNLPGGTAAGLHISEGRLWVLDAGSRRLTRYAYDAGTLSAQDSVELGLRLPSGATIHGMVAGGDYLWVLTSEPAVLHRFALKSLAWKGATR
jgi:hypothetical protein